jgi:hypothetical protein
MTVLESVLSFALFAMYVVCLFTVCSMTFAKGRTLLGVAGIFLPFLWLIGAVLPAKPGSRFAALAAAPAAPSAVQAAPAAPPAAPA